MNRHALLPLMMALCMAACSTSGNVPTVYQEAGGPTSGRPFGDSDKKIADDEYSIVVTGNAKTDRQRVLDIALLRAGHITQEQRRDYFIIINQLAEEQPGYESVSAPIGGLLVWLPVGENPTRTPRAVLLIRLLPTDTAPDANALKASDVIAEVGKRLADSTASSSRTS